MKNLQQEWNFFLKKHMLDVKEYSMKNLNYYIFFFFWKYHFVCYCLCQIFRTWEWQRNVKRIISILLLLMFYFTYCPVFYLAGHLKNKQISSFCLFLVEYDFNCNFVNLQNWYRESKTTMLIFSFCELIAASNMFSFEIKYIQNFVLW